MHSRTMLSGYLLGIIIDTIGIIAPFDSSGYTLVYLSIVVSCTCFIIIIFTTRVHTTVYLKGKSVSKNIIVNLYIVKSLQGIYYLVNPSKYNIEFSLRNL